MEARRKARHVSDANEVSKPGNRPLERKLRNSKVGSEPPRAPRNNQVKSQPRNAEIQSMGLKVGFTGTRKGMTPRQGETLVHLLLKLGAVEFHHGDCQGADIQAHRATTVLGIPVSVHPPEDDKSRAFAISPDVRQAKPYIKRNHDIVDETDVLIATPSTSVEQQRSGTWATVRYARRTHKRVVIIQSDGTIV